MLTDEQINVHMRFDNYTKEIIIDREQHRTLFEAVKIYTRTSKLQQLSEQKIKENGILMNGFPPSRE